MKILKRFIAQYLSGIEYESTTTFFKYRFDFSYRKVRYVGTLEVKVFLVPEEKGKLMKDIAKDLQKSSIEEQFLYVLLPQSTQALSDTINYLRAINESLKKNFVYVALPVRIIENHTEIATINIKEDHQLRDALVTVCAIEKLQRENTVIAREYKKEKEEELKSIIQERISEFLIFSSIGREPRGVFYVASNEVKIKPEFGRNNLPSVIKELCKDCKYPFGNVQKTISKQIFNNLCKLIASLQPETNFSTTLKTHVENVNKILLPLGLGSVSAREFKLELHEDTVAHEVLVDLTRMLQEYDQLSYDDFAKKFLKKPYCLSNYALEIILVALSRLGFIQFDQQKKIIRKAKLLSIERWKQLIEIAVKLKMLDKNKTAEYQSPDLLKQNSLAEKIRKWRDRACEEVDISFKFLQKLNKFKDVAEEKLKRIASHLNSFKNALEKIKEKFESSSDYLETFLHIANEYNIGNLYEEVHRINLLGQFKISIEHPIRAELTISQLLDFLKDTEETIKAGCELKFSQECSPEDFIVACVNYIEDTSSESLLSVNEKAQRIMQYLITSYVNIHQQAINKASGVIGSITELVNHLEDLSNIFGSIRYDLQKRLKDIRLNKKHSVEIVYPCKLCNLRVKELFDEIEKIEKIEENLIKELPSKFKRAISDAIGVSRLLTATPESFEDLLINLGKITSKLKELEENVKKDIHKYRLSDIVTELIRIVNENRGSLQLLNEQMKYRVLPIRDLFGSKSIMTIDEAIRELHRYKNAGYTHISME